MELYLHRNGEQVGPYSKEQIGTMLGAGELSRNDFVWHEGLSEWQRLDAVFSLPAAMAPAPQVRQAGWRPPARLMEIKTNVRQGAIIGGWVCFGLGIGCMVWSLLLFFFYGPLFLVAFILSIVAMSQRRVLGGVMLLVATLLIPAGLGVALLASRSSKFAESIASSRDTSAAGIGQSLSELRERKLASERKLVALGNFRVVSAKFTKSQDSIGMNKPIIELTVENLTGQAVKRAYFRGVLSSPGRSIPWVDDTFNYEVAGGVEPGETLEWRLAPNMFGEWGKVEVPQGAEFNVSVIRLDGADGAELFGNARFDDDDAKRLAELEAQSAGQ